MTYYRENLGFDRVGAWLVEARAPLPITDATIERFLANRDHEIRLMAEVDGELVGIGAVVLNKSELRACYVAPSAVRRGVGSALGFEACRSIDAGSGRHPMAAPFRPSYPASRSVRDVAFR